MSVCLCQVVFKNIVLIKDRKINEWLTMVEEEMRFTLATLLAQAVQGISQFRSTSIDQTQYDSSFN